MFLKKEGKKINHISHSSIIVYTYDNPKLIVVLTSLQRMAEVRLGKWLERSESASVIEII